MNPLTNPWLPHLYLKLDKRKHLKFAFFSLRISHSIFQNTGDINAPPGSAKVPATQTPPPSASQKDSSAAKKEGDKKDTPPSSASADDKNKPPIEKKACPVHPTSTERRDSIDMPTFEEENAAAGLASLKLECFQV